jgi:photosystem II stability/assembly factor-like uncharacterized protein
VIKSTILASTDGGMTWSDASPSAHQVLRGVTCATGGACLAVGNGGTILQSVHGAAG